MKPAIVVDSTATLTDELRARKDLFVVPLTVNYANGDVIDDPSSDADIEAFYDRMDKEAVLPTTSQPAPGKYYELFDHLIAEGYDTVYIITITSGASGTYQTALGVAQEYKDRLNIHLYDSFTSTVNVEIMTEQLAKDIDAGKDHDTIDRHIRYMIQNCVLYVMIGSLENLHKGGRLSGTAKFIGNLLKMRPIVSLNKEDGSLFMLDKIRTNRRVYQQMLTWLGDFYNKYDGKVVAGIIEGRNEKEAAELTSLIKESYPDLEIRQRKIGTVIGVHVGAGGLGLTLNAIPQD